MPVDAPSTNGASLPSGGSLNLVLNKPSGTVEGDLLTVSVVLSTNVVITPPADTVPWQVTVNAAGVKGYWKVAGPSEPATYTFTRAANTNDIEGTIVRVTGAHKTAPIDTATAQAGGTGTSIVIPSLTVGLGTFLLQIASSLSTCTFDPPTTATEIADTQHPSANLTSAVGYEPVSAGATGTRTWTATVSAVRSGIMWSIIPADGINRAAVLYPRNAATLDTGAGVDVRLLHSGNTGSNDVTQSAQFTNANDNVERTFDPATANVTNTNHAGTTLFKMGWALRLVDDMTPEDGTNCNAMLPAGTLTVNAVMVPTFSGTNPPTGQIAPTFRASLWRYDPSTDTGTLIAAGASDTSVSWTVATLGNESGVAKAVVVPITVAAAVEFAAGEILLLQFGFNTNNVPNPVVGTHTTSMALRVDATGTNITWDTDPEQGIRVACALSSDLVGEGLTSRNPYTVVLLEFGDAGHIRQGPVGEGVVSRSASAVALSRDVVGEGLVSRTLAVAEDFDVVGEGLVSRAVAVAEDFDLAGEGLVSRVVAVTLPRDVTGEGLVSSTKAVTAAKTFDLTGEGLVSRVLAVALPRDVVGEGVVSMSRQVAAAKTFDVTGEGEVTRQVAVVLSRSVTGEGEVTYTRQALITKTFDVVGEGLITELHPVTAYRTFDLTGAGEILTTGPNGSTICVPIDELPTGACPEDWPDNDGLCHISGTLFDHETGAPIAGATVVLVRDSDGLRATTTVTDGAGAYTFPRGTTDPYTYRVEFVWNNAGTLYTGLSATGCAPVCGP